MSTLSNTLNLLDVIKVSWKNKKFISYFVIISAIISVVISLLLPNIYRSEAILAPSTNESPGLSGSLSGLGGLASMAGISLPSQSTNSAEALETLSTLGFFENNFLPYIHLQDLMAVDSWDPSSNKINYKIKKYDPETEKWVREVKFPRKVIPSSQEAFKEFKKRFSVNEDKKTGFVTISIEHKSPYIAHDWTNLMIKNVNEKFRNDHRKKANSAIKYLNDIMANTNYFEVKNAIAQLIQAETQKIVMIESNPEYVYTIIDSPVVSERKAKPSRAFICIAGTMLGSILAILITLFRNREEI